MNPAGDRPVALITGASGGLGEAMARRWREAGYRIVAVSRSRPEDDGFIDDFIDADLTRPGAAGEAFAAFAGRWPRLDLLINNAGMGAYAGWEELPEQDWRRLMELDLFAAVELTRAALPLLRRSRGCVVNISSVAGLVPVPGMGAYSAAKFALTAFSESLAAELEPAGVAVLTVYPGRIRTGFSHRAVTIRPVPDTPGAGASSARGLAERVFKAVRKRRRSLIYPRWYGLFVAFARRFPTWYGRMAVKMWDFK